ncbi:MAG: pyruvate kinase [Flavobacteriales bacterium]|nr:pyruvate kinase [Flavobacteriales bacterium]
MTRRTKIVATLGPVSSSYEQIKKLVEAGVNVCRINFSHGKHEDLVEVIQHIRNINEELGVHTAILGDLQGPKIRVGEMEPGTILEDGQEFILTNQKCVGNKEKAYISYQEIPKDVKAGELILMDDGKLQMEVISTNYEDQVILKVTHGGVLSSKKGVNLPNTKISQPCLTEKDLIDLDFCLEHNLDWIGLSFVRSARDIIELKHIISSKNKSSKVVAKIEKPEAIAELSDIIKITDAVMVARGDLGVEIPMQDVPLLQKKIVQKCLENAKPVIIATQMMESMIENIAPTRAEVTDVANAVMDGADAVMLSGETSVGAHPVEVIKAMCKIINKVEADYDQLYEQERVPEKNQERFITDSICFNACRLSARVDGKAIVTMTHSGYTGFKISSQRPRAKIFVFSGNKKLLTTMSLVWGVKTFYYDKMVSTDHTIADIKYLLKKEGFVKEGDLIINTASMPIEDKGNTNMLKLSYIE